ncbi:MAG TPA: pyridoxine 5'-phosphate synthase [Candidatus Dormibacteraeota bacterium]|nr:pyridoxine 5'-phosphate synthase [Candidatus Dormibacteraeota bacterium]
MRLYVNIDHVATLREARKTDEPDPVKAAAVVERAGADGVTVHLREDRRHIQDADVRALVGSVRTVLNLELGASPAIVAIASRLKPFQATLVPERRQEITTEGGLVLRRGDRRIAAAVRRLSGAGIRVSLFIDPDRATIDRAADLGVPAVELHTGRYAHTWRKSDAALRALARAAAHARARGLAVHAGHGLTYENVQPVAAIAEIEELNIGHSIVSNAVFWGLEEAVRRMRALVDGARSVAPPR